MLAGEDEGNKTTPSPDISDAPLYSSGTAGRSRIHKQSIKTITVKSLINFVLIGAVIMMIITAVGFRWVSHKIIKDKALDVSEVVLAGLTSHMKAGIMDKREYFLEEIRSVREIRGMRIVRGPQVVAQFGPGGKAEKAPDHLASSVFETRKPAFITKEFAREPAIRAIIPYVASSSGVLNCLNCHHVPENTVLGALDIEIDLTEYRDLSLWIMSIITFLTIVFIALVVVNTTGTIQRYVVTPLGSLISRSRVAFVGHKPINPDLYESVELETVAKEINLFNSEIMRKHDELQQMNEKLLCLNDEIEETLRETVFTMGVIEEKRSRETKNHTLRVTLYSNLLASKAGLPEGDIDLITTASPLHDIGKIGIADAILLKPGRFNEGEFEIMKSHADIGYAMLVHSRRDILRAAAIIASQHHEKWDGTGYPQGLKGEDIHIFGRIVALSDVFDALVSARVYKESWEIEDIIGHFRAERGKHFDPRLVDIFLEHVDVFMEIYEKNH